MSSFSKLQCTLNGTIAELPQFFARFHVWAAGNNIPGKLLSSFELMLDELLTNIALHAYEGRGGFINVLIEFESPARLSATLRDEGPYFDPTVRFLEDSLDAPMDERKIGGLGIHFVRNLADQFVYRRDGHMNELFFSRALSVGTT